MEPEKTIPQHQKPQPETQPFVQRKGGGGGFFGTPKHRPFFAPQSHIIQDQKAPEEYDNQADLTTSDTKQLTSDDNALPNDTNSNNSDDTNKKNNNNFVITPPSYQKQQSDNALQAKLTPILRQVIQTSLAPPPKLNAQTINRGMFKGTVIKSQTSGNVDIDGSESKHELKVKSPIIEIIVDAGLADGVELDANVGIEAGPIQTMTVSDRTGIYRHGGKGGEILFQQRIVKPLSRDAAKNTDGTGYAPPPWYYRPQNPNAQPQVSLHDEPWFALPKRLGNGVLTEIKGKSEFVASIAVRVVGTDNLIHLYQFKWTVPWDMDISSTIDNSLEETFSASGGKGIIFNDKITETPTALKDEKVANNIANASWIVVPNVSAAMQLHHRQLIPNIIAAKANGDNLSAQYCISALKAKNPPIKCKVWVNEAQSVTTKDAVKIIASSAGATFTSEEVAMNNEDVKEILIPLSNALDIDKMDGSSQLTFLLKPIDKETTWTFPWASANTRNFVEKGTFARNFDYSLDLSL